MKRHFMRGMGLGLLLVAAIMLVFYAPVAYSWVLDLRHLTVSRVIALGIVYAPVVGSILIGSHLRKKYK